MAPFERVLVKVSGEALMGTVGHGIDPQIMAEVATDLAEAAQGRELAVVVGGGNIFRGLQSDRLGLDRPTGDALGRLATVMNALALASAVTAAGRPALAMSAEAMPSLCETYSRRHALAAMAGGQVVVLAGGVGAPFFTTDSGAALRGAELGCSLLLKATGVDGVYSADPRKDPRAMRYERLTHTEAIAQGLGVMDTAAFALARENRLPIRVFALRGPRAISTVLAGGGVWTDVVPDDDTGCEKA